MKKWIKALVLCLGLCLIISFECKADHSEDIVVVIDPGHGGDNLGTQVLDGYEKEVNLKVAKAMYDQLSMYEGVTVYLTHETDKDLSLKKRAQIADEKQADFLISLHFNASESHESYGAECWVPYDDFYETTYEFASYFMDEFKNIGLFDRGIKTRLNDEGDNYYGIIRESEKLDIPCVLVEHCHVDNYHDDEYYATDKKLKEFGIMDAEAVAKYLGLKSKRLGNDYTDYSIEVSIPLSENTRDKTGPSECVLTTKEYNEYTGELTLILTTREDESRLLYYDYSIDGGISFSERFPLEKENIEISLFLKEGYTPEIIARAYNLNEVYTESNCIVMDTIVYVPTQEDMPTIQLTKEEREQKEFRQKMISFLIIIVIILAICFFGTLVLYIVQTIRHKKRRKQRRNMQRKK